MKKFVCSLFVSIMLIGTAGYAQPIAPAVVGGTNAGLNWRPILVTVPIIIALIAGVAAGDDDHSVHSHS